jgi:hypothetical protein
MVLAMFAFSSRRRPRRGRAPFGDRAQHALATVARGR